MVVKHSPILTRSKAKQEAMQQNQNLEISQFQQSEFTTPTSSATSETLILPSNSAVDTSVIDMSLITGNVQIAAAIDDDHIMPRTDPVVSEENTA